jgi:hypothetical protein
MIRLYLKTGPVIFNNYFIEISSLGMSGGNTVSKQNLEHFFFRKMLRNKIPKVFFYVCPTEWNSDLFSLPLNAPEQNLESLHLFLFHGRGGITICFLFREMLRNNFRNFASISFLRFFCSNEQPELCWK